MKRINGELQPITDTFPPVGKLCLVLLKDGTLVTGRRNRFKDVTVRGDEVFGKPDRVIRGADEFSSGGSGSNWKTADCSAAILLDDIWFS